MVVLALLLAAPHGGTQAQDEVEVKIRWVTYVNPTDGIDYVFGTCVFSDYIAVVGWAESLKKPYIVLLRKSDGSVVKEWIDKQEVYLGFNCISIDGKLYTVSTIISPTLLSNNRYGAIYVFDENLNILARIISKDLSVYYSLAYDGKALYIGGVAPEDVNRDGNLEGVGLVEKRALDKSLSLINSKKIYFDSWKQGWIYGIGVDPSTGRIWAVGLYEDFKDKRHSLIVILDSDLRVLKVIDYPEGSEGYLGTLTDVAFDGRYVYVSGDRGVAKFSVNGELVAINRDGMWLRAKIVYYNNYLYVFGVDHIGGYWRHVLYIHDTNLSIIKRYVLSENVNAHSTFQVGRPALEGSNIYVAGIDYALGSENSRVVVYSLSIGGVTITTTTGTEDVTTTANATTTAATAPTTITSNWVSEIIKMLERLFGMGETLVGVVLFLLLLAFMLPYLKRVLFGGYVTP